MKRPSKRDYYLSIAEKVSKRGTCIRRNSGAVIVKNDEIVSTGYTGSPRSYINCIDRGVCQREELNIKSGERYELCKSVHAEMNACISASRKEMLGGTLYLVTLQDGKRIETEPCKLCARVLINAGIERVVK